MKLAAKHYEESIGEMKHADRIIERVLFLEGVPEIARYDVIRVGTNVKEQFENDLKLESGGVDAVVADNGVVVNYVANHGQAGFKTQTKDEASGTVSAGNVIRTEPAAGTNVKKGETVTIVVSSGPMPAGAPTLRQFQKTFACVSTAPFGCPVVPAVYRMRCGSAKRACASAGSAVAAAPAMRRSYSGPISTSPRGARVVSFAASAACSSPTNNTDAPESVNW